jgi:hypothetical protein
MPLLTGLLTLINFNIVKLRLSFGSFQTAQSNRVEAIFNLSQIVHTLNEREQNGEHV